LRKPCGPKKLIRAVHVSLDVLENGQTRTAPIQENLAVSTHAPSRPNAGDRTDLSSRSIRTLASRGNSPYPHDQAINNASYIDQQQPSQLEPQHDTVLSLGPHSCSSAAPPATSSPVTPRSEVHTPSGQRSTVPTAATASAAISPASVNADATPRKPKILCVEDNKINMMLVTTYLKKKGYPFETACDGAIAFEKVKTGISHGGFDCILMDLRKLNMH
jgi:CheY-like chemotaxis protein